MPERKKILISCVTFDGGNLVPLLLRTRYWQRKGIEVTFFGNKELKNQIKSLKIISKFNFIELTGTKNTNKKVSFMLEALKRNFLAIFYINKIRNEKFTSIYSISAVLDMILFPYLIKHFDKKINWVVVFDNTVPLFSNGRIIAGNKLVRVLAWVFYQFSLLFLRKADHIFAIKSELKDYFIQKGFDSKKITITGNGVEIDLIKNARNDPRYNFDALFIGRINEAKGIYDMLKVIKIIKNEYPKFKLAIMGSGDEPTMKQYKSEINNMGLNENIIFLGYRTGQDKFNIIKSSKCFLFLSETESVPVAPLEAVCTGLNAFVYDLDAYKMYKNNELVITSKNDYKTVAKKVLKLFKSKDFENKKGKLLLERHSWDKIANIELNEL